ncbi:leucine-zipper of insertion element IS481 [Pseudomonas pohangensis]|uniref:Leucine-zipper of insertion element IS481 n=1 Tax=Pseudomonas pohangensis TaxID=364197 RepID=A0A1H2FJM7_9PSED|nr:leucine-zipper of insertion element IS481 [Pseudomonas pohangensis]
MNWHKHARLTSLGRALLVRHIQHGLRVEEAAQAVGVSVRTACKWLKRFREEDETALHCPHTPADLLIERAIDLRRARASWVVWTGPPLQDYFRLSGLYRRPPCGFALRVCS